MGDVVELECQTLMDIPPDKVLEAAKGQLEYVLVLGLTKDGAFWAASSGADMAQAVYAASKFIHKEHDGDYGG